tara:strand:+ start:248 stop:445 length:198 start_codon:yes stop_codon:yes gene_type:complete
MAKIFRYHVETPTGERLESNIPEYAQAETIVHFLQDKTQRNDLLIIEEHVPQLLKGKLGRDPDLH